MGRWKFKRKRKIRGRGTPDFLKNKIFFGKRAQTGKGVVSNALPPLLQYVAILSVFNEI